MTATLERPTTTAWSAVPGWGIVADLTPPELTARRRLHVLRRLIAAGVALVVLVCAAGYVLALSRAHQAADELTAAQERAVSFQRQAGRYAGVTKLQTTITAVDVKLATLLGGDVAVDDLQRKLLAAVPSSMTISQESLNVAAPAGAPPAASTATAGLGSAGAHVIGTGGLSGAATSLDDLPALVDALSSVPGVVEVMPTSNQAGDRGAVSWTLSFAITDQLLTHRYSATKGTGR